MSLAVSLGQPTEYDRAVNYALARETISAPMMAKELGIAGAVAKTFMGKMADAGLITPPNDIGRSRVLRNADDDSAADAAPRATDQDGAPIVFSSDDIISGAAQTRLRTIIERIERLEEDKAGISGDIKEVYDEAKGEGFEVKILRKVVSLRKKDKVKRDEEEAILDLYLTAIGDR